MSDMPLTKKSLVYHGINDNYGMILDPENVFWSIISKNEDGDSYLPRKMISQYEDIKDRLDKELLEFRFSSNLTAIYINPTERCNACCPYCYIPDKTRKYGRSMTEKELDYVLNKIAKHFKNSLKKPVIVFHASEPLLVKDIVFKMIVKFKSRFHFGLQTNALLLNKKDVSLLKKYRVGVGISLDSFIPNVNNRLRCRGRRKGNFEEAVKAIEWFRGYEGLNVITTITKLNVTHLPSIVEFLHTKNVRCVLLNPVRITQKSAITLCPDEKILTKYFIRAINTAIELSRNSKDRIIIGNFANIILGIIAPSARRLMCDVSPCGGGRCFLTITASGEMIPCGEFVGLKGFSGGNIFNNTISKAMESSPFKQVRSRIVERIAECDVCKYRNICGAPCPAELHSCGSMYKKSVFCEFYQKIIHYAFKLISENKEKYLFRQNFSKKMKYEYCL